MREREREKGGREGQDTHAQEEEITEILVFQTCLQRKR